MRALFTFFWIACVALVHAGEFTIEGEALYVHPLVDETYFVRAGNLATNEASRIANDLTWRPAYRLALFYSFCNSTVEIRGTYLDVKHTKHLSTSVASDFLSPTQGIPTPFFFTSATASSAIETRFWEVEALFGQCLNGCWGIHYGLEFADISFRERISFARTVSFASTTLFNKDHFWGVGPELALDLNYCLWSLPLYLTGNFRTALLASQSRSSFDQTLNGSPYFNANNDKIWRLVPLIDLRLGLASEWNCFCVTTHLEVGYEFYHIHQAIHKVAYHDVHDSVDFSGSEDLYGNFSFHGPYLLLGLRF